MIITVKMHVDLVELAEITGKLKKYRHNRYDHRRAAASCPIHKIMFWLVGISVLIATLLIVLTAESPFSGDFHHKAWGKDGALGYHLKAMYERNSNGDRYMLETLGNYISCLNAVASLELDNTLKRLTAKVQRHEQLLASHRDRSLLPKCFTATALSSQRPSACHCQNSADGPTQPGNKKNVFFNRTFDDVISASEPLGIGGSWKPRNCTARSRIAVIIPYRDREQHLATLLYYLHPHLQRLKLDYRIFVVQQTGKEAFNKGVLMNTGFQYVLQSYPADCLVLHDVDLIPEDDRIEYSCSENPRHLSIKVSTLEYKLPYETLVGGILAITPEQFVKCNGFSNLFYNWGGEDDDMYVRIRSAGMSIDRPHDVDLYRFTMASHNRTRVRPYDEHKLLENTATMRLKCDGLTSLRPKLLAVDELPHHTRIYVLVDSPEDLREQTTFGCSRVVD